MKKIEDFKELDKQVSDSIMKKLKGHEVEHSCEECGGKGWMPKITRFSLSTLSIIEEEKMCENCNGWGKVTIEY